MYINIKLKVDFVSLYLFYVIHFQVIYFSSLLFIDLSWHVIFEQIYMFMMFSKNFLENKKKIKLLKFVCCLSKYFLSILVLLAVCCLILLQLRLGKEIHLFSGNFLFLKRVLNENSGNRGNI